VTATPNVHSEPTSRSSVRAGAPTPFRRCPCWASRWAMRAYQVCPSPLVGGPVDQPYLDREISPSGTADAASPG
jgi:hypothetical protein